MRWLSATAGVLAALTILTPAQEINPYPRDVMATQKLIEWTFAEGTAGWRGLNDCTVSTADRTLKVQCTGNDPYVISPAFRMDGPLTVRLRARCAAAGIGQFFWMTAQSPRFGEEKSTRFQLIHDGQWHDYTVPLEAEGAIVRLRFDPGHAPGLVEIARIELVREVLHPLELQSVRADGRRLELRLFNHSTDPIHLSVGTQRWAIAGQAALTVTFQCEGSVPFESREVVVHADHLPPVRRTIFVVDPEADGDWIERSSGSLAVHIARDGSGARIELGGQLVGWIAPLVSRDGRIVRLRPVDAGNTLRFAGEDIAAAIALRPDEIAVTIESDQPVEGPVLRVLGPLEQGVFAGLEYLGKGERSSSTLDIETAEHIRFAPDPLKVTMPLMAFITDRVSAAMTWNDMELQPVYATPNFLDGAEGHRAALRGRKIEATVLVRPPARVEDAIVWAVKRRGLPPLPAPPRDRAAQAALCRTALTGPPLKTDAGWGHCADPRWERRPFADIASTVWRLTGEVPRCPELVPGGAHLPNDAIYFVTGRAGEWLKVRSSRAKRLIAGQKHDGSWRYSGKYQRGHHEDTASGYCARPAFELLDFARLTGDTMALDAGVKALEFMKKFRTPRGAQTWEVPLHTPDVLASAFLVMAYVRGYELTGNPAWLEEARRWAISGLPFVYQWSRYPMMAYATIAVFGATNWRAPNWIGLPVQWCGLVYAYALTMLAAHDKTLDWRHLAEGILISAEQQQQPDGDYAGCLPDSFAIAAQRRNGPWINPSLIVNLRLVLDGQLDSLALLRDGQHRVVAPFPGMICDGTVRIEAKTGAVYQLLVDGQRIVDVKSQGEDRIRLE